MAYEYEIQGNYGQGWEMVTTEDNPIEANKRLQEYRENEPYPFKIVMKKVK